MKEKSKAFPILYPNAAGIDISSKEHYVAVNQSRVQAQFEHLDLLQKI